MELKKITQKQLDLCGYRPDLDCVLQRYDRLMIAPVDRCVVLYSSHNVKLHKGHRIMWRDEYGDYLQYTVVHVGPYTEPSQPSQPESYGGW